jgi:H+-translocating NAD(P) transhydrogenase subunit alpha
VDVKVLLLLYVTMLAIFLGVELIGKVPGTLHTPLMSGTNAIHGIVVLGAMIVLGQADTWWLRAIGFVAVVLGAANVFGGFVVTDRMLEMFKRKPGQRQGANRA